jgi:hypothetical protein
MMPRYSGAVRVWEEGDQSFSTRPRPSWPLFPIMKAPSEDRHATNRPRARPTGKGGLVQAVGSQDVLCVLFALVRSRFAFGPPLNYLWGSGGAACLVHIIRRRRARAQAVFASAGDGDAQVARYAGLRCLHLK